MVKNYYEKREADIRARWFPNHVAKFSTVEVGKSSLTWRQPTTSNYFCRYLIDGNFLLVYGDIGDAVYGWSEQISWEFLAGLNLDYFAGKCCASEFGRGYKEWDEEVAVLHTGERLKELMDRRGTDDESKHDAAEIEAYEDMEPGMHKGDCQKAAQAVYDASGDAETASAISEYGEVIALRCQAHLIGIKMALAQAEKNSKIVLAS